MALIRASADGSGGGINPVIMPFGTWGTPGQVATITLSEPIKKAHILITGNGSTISGINATYIQGITQGLPSDTGNFAYLNVYEYDGPAVSSFSATGYQGYSIGVVLKYE